MGHDLSNDLLRAFVTVLEEGTISKAAVVLHRTQAALSLQIKRLEDGMGVKLLERSPKGIITTVAGSLLLPYATKILTLSEEAKQLMLKINQVETIRIGMLEDIAIGALPKILEEFTKNHPNVRLEIIVNDSKSLSELLSFSKLEIVIGAPEFIEATPEFLWNEDLVWVASKKFELKKGQELPLISFASYCPWQETALKKLDENGIGWRVALSSISFNAISSAVSAGVGVSCMLRCSVNMTSDNIYDRYDYLPYLGGVNIGVYINNNACRSECTMSFCNKIISELAKYRNAQFIENSLVPDSALAS